MCCLCYVGWYGSLDQWVFKKAILLFVPSSQSFSLSHLLQASSSSSDSKEEEEEEEERRRRQWEDRALQAGVLQVPPFFLPSLTRVIKDDIMPEETQEEEDNKRRSRKEGEKMDVGSFQTFLPSSSQMDVNRGHDGGYHKQKEIQAHLSSMTQQCMELQQMLSFILSSHMQRIQLKQKRQKEEEEEEEEELATDEKEMEEDTSVLSLFASSSSSPHRIQEYTGYLLVSQDGLQVLEEEGKVWKIDVSPILHNKQQQNESKKKANSAFDNKGNMNVEGEEDDDEGDIMSYLSSYPFSQASTLLQYHDILHGQNHIYLVPPIIDAQHEDSSNEDQEGLQEEDDLLAMVEDEEDEED